jgi:hypothetical protein
MKVKIAPEYNSNYLETDRPQTLSDKRIESLIQEVLSGYLKKDISDQIYNEFKELASDYILNSTTNSLVGLDYFTNLEIINGCTQFIDNLYMSGPVQTLEGDYRYHLRLNPNLVYSTLGNLKPNVPLIIALPFPSTGEIHHLMEDIIQECEKKNIDIHIDGAWITCSNRLEFNFDRHPIKSVGISLSKGLGLGWNRVGLRWSKEYDSSDAVSIMNDYHMNNRALVIIGNHFLRNLPKDYLWAEHANRYYKICDDFKLTPTRSIHIAMRENHPVGVAPLIRYLEEHGL